MLLRGGSGNDLAFCGHFVEVDLFMSVRVETLEMTILTLSPSLQVMQAIKNLTVSSVVAGAILNDVSCVYTRYSRMLCKSMSRERVVRKCAVRSYLLVKSVRSERAAVKGFYVDSVRQISSDLDP